jgi:hypothetical protein
LGGELGSLLDEYDPTGIRHVGQVGSGSDAVGFYYVPGRRASLVSGSCLAKLPARQQRLLRAYQRRFPPGPGYCLVGLITGEAFPAGCGTLEEPLAGYAFSLVQSYGSRLIGLVPDGVATVRISYRGGVTASGAVSNNLFIADAPSLATRKPACGLSATGGRRRPCTQRDYVALVRAETPLAVSWLGATGALVRHFALTPAYLHDAEATDGLTEPFIDP